MGSSQRPTKRKPSVTKRSTASTKAKFTPTPFQKLPHLKSQEHVLKRVATIQKEASSTFVMRKQLQAYSHIRAYKCKLNRVILCPIANRILREMALGMSQAANMASDFANIHFIRLLGAGIDVPTLEGSKGVAFYQSCLNMCINQLVVKFVDDDPLIEETRQQWFPTPGVTLPTFGDAGATYHSQILKFVAADLATNARTMVYTTLKGRTCALLKLVFGFGNAKLARHATDVIYGDTPRQALTDDESALVMPRVAEHREMLGLDMDGVATAEWIGDKNNFQAIVGYQFQVQQRISRHVDEHGTGKNFALLPQTGLHRRCIQIDNEALVSCILPAVKAVLKAQSTEDSRLTLDRLGTSVSVASMSDPAVRDAVWGRVFDFTPIIRSKGSGLWKFNGTIRTDGTTVSVYQRRFNYDREQWRRVVTSDGEYELMNLWEHDRGLFAAGEIESNGIPEEYDVIAIDPGNKDLMSSVRESDDQHHSLGKRQYQSESGVFMAMRKQEKWQQSNEEVTAALNALSETTKKGGNFVDYYRYLLTKWANWEVLWAEYGSERYANLAFTKFRRKHKSLDAFIKRILRDRDPSKVVVAFGAGRWPTARKGEVTGPLVGLARRLGIFVKTVYVREAYTSQRCFGCGSQLHSPRMCTKRRVMRGGRMVRREVVAATNNGVWGLKQCLNTDCESYTKLVNRDVNGAKNIGRVFFSWMNGREHPSYLDRDVVLF